VKVMVDINVAIIGCDNVANNHFVAWRRIPYAKVVAIRDTNKKAVERVALDWKISRRFTSVSEMSELKEITLWDICTPIQTHKFIANLAMKKGFDVHACNGLWNHTQSFLFSTFCQKVCHH